MAAKPKSKNTRPAARPAARRPAPAPQPSAPPEPVVNRVAASTAPALARLSRLPKAFLPVLVAVSVIAGLALQGIVGLLILVAVVALLGWLLAAFWPMIPTPGRVIRVGALVAVLAIGVLQL